MEPTLNCNHLITSNRLLNSVSFHHLITSVLALAGGKHRNRLSSRLPLILEHLLRETFYPVGLLACYEKSATETKPPDWLSDFDNSPLADYALYSGSDSSGRIRLIVSKRSALLEAFLIRQRFDRQEEADNWS